MIVKDASIGEKGDDQYNKMNLIIKTTSVQYLGAFVISTATSKMRQCGFSVCIDACHFVSNSQLPIYLPVGRDVSSSCYCYVRWISSCIYHKCLYDLLVR